MSLIRQIWLLLLATLLLAFAASVTVNVRSARDTLQTQHHFPPVPGFASSPFTSM